MKTIFKFLLKRQTSNYNLSINKIVCVNYSTDLHDFDSSKTISQNQEKDNQHNKMHFHGLTWDKRYRKKRNYNHREDLMLFEKHLETKKQKQQMNKDSKLQLNNPSYELKIFNNLTEVTLENTISKFSELEIHPQLKQNIQKLEYEEMTAIQKNVIKLINEGKDVMACSKTGSGKTIAFLLPIVNKILHDQVKEIPYNNESSYPVCVILAPTRELAEQIYGEARKVCHKTSLIVTRIYGGVPSGPQIRELHNGIDILIATPGRLIDLTKRGYVNLSHANNLIIDEADRMLDMGFQPQLEEIFSNYNMPMKKDRQNLLFSATFPKEVRQLAINLLNDYYMISVTNNDDAIVNENIQHTLVKINDIDVYNQLLDLIKTLEGQILIFCEKKFDVDRLQGFLLRNSISCQGIHGDKTQSQRQNAIDSFSKGSSRILVATDVASRGIDFPAISYVINLEIPNNIESYIHRVGRTGRSGNKGTAITFIKDNESRVSMELKNLLIKFNQEIPSWFEEICINSIDTYRDQSYKNKRNRFSSFDRKHDRGFQRINYDRNNHRDNAHNYRDDFNKEYRDNQYNRRNNKEFKNYNSEFRNNNQDFSNNNKDFRYNQRNLDRNPLNKL